MVPGLGPGATLTNGPAEVEVRSVETEQKIDDFGIVGHGEVDPVMVTHLSLLEVWNKQTQC